MINEKPWKYIFILVDGVLLCDSHLSVIIFLVPIWAVELLGLLHSRWPSPRWRSQCRSRSETRGRLGKNHDIYSHFKTHSTADNKLTLKGYCHKFLESQVTFLSFSFHRSLIAVTRKNYFRFAQILQVLPVFEEFI